MRQAVQVPAASWPHLPASGLDARHRLDELRRVRLVAQVQHAAEVSARHSNVRQGGGPRPRGNDQLLVRDGVASGCGQRLGREVGRCDPGACQVGDALLRVPRSILPLASDADAGVKAGKASGTWTWKYGPQPAALVAASSISSLHQWGGGRIEVVFPRLA